MVSNFVCTGNENQEGAEVVKIPNIKGRHSFYIFTLTAESEIEVKRQMLFCLFEIMSSVIFMV